MRIAPKSPEVLAAQASLYFVESRKNFRGSFALEAGMRLAYGNGCYADHEEFTDQADGYVSFLRNISGTSDPRVEHIANLFCNYRGFQDVVHTLGAANTSNPNYLGRGSYSDGFRLRGSDSSDLAVRVVRNLTDEISQVISHVAVDAAIRDVDGNLERLVAASPWGVTISQMVPGMPVDKILETIHADEDQIGDFINTIQRINKVGVEIDFSDGNVFYDENSGFGAIDMRYVGNGLTEGKNLDQFTDFADVFLSKENLETIKSVRNKIVSS